MSLKNPRPLRVANSPLRGVGKSTNGDSPQLYHFGITAEVDGSAAKTEMVTLVLDGIVSVTAVLLDYSLKNTSAIHAVRDYIQAAKMRNQFKLTRVILACN